MSVRNYFEDAALKAFSLICAVFLFLFVSVEDATPVDVDFRIEYRVADDIMVVSDAPGVLHTTLQGPWAAFRTFELADMEPVVIDMSHADPGVQRHIIDLSAIAPPGGMRVVAVRPSEVEVTLDRRVERQVPVHADIPELPASGFEILDVRLVPARARVTGPASKMQSVDFITTRAIDVAGREDDLNLEVDLRPPPPPLRLVDRRVAVFVEIGEEFVQRSFADVPVAVRGAPRGAHATPEAVTLVVRGPRRAIAKMVAAELTATVDVAAAVAAGETVAEHAVQLAPELPERAQLIAPVPKITVQLPTSRRARRK